ATNDMDIRLVVKDDRGCLASDGLALTIVLGDIYAPNAFSPDEDGENDYFTFYSDGGSGEQVEKLQIFDRWGSLVFDQRNFDLNRANIGWNGQFNGNLMPAGVYAYRAVIRFGDGSKQVIKGDVSLMR
ncbi:MAG: gliding motility-associated C-terminal domain-containing protein, partial [Bacteroidota bacterium]